MGCEKVNLVVVASVCLIIVALHNCDASLAHLESSEKCVPIRECEPVMRLLRVPMIKIKIFDDIRKAQCGIEGTEYKIYCDVQKIIRKPERFETAIAAHWRDYMTTAVPPPHDPLFKVDTRVAQSAIDEHPNFKLLDLDICGPVPEGYMRQIRTRIFGGRMTEIDEYPWMALLFYHEFVDGIKPRKKFGCGATVVNHNHVLTAAHCVTHLTDRFKLIGVRIGEHNMSSEQDCKDSKCNAKHEDFGIDRIFPHSNYSNETLRNDIALIRLKGSIDFKRTQVRPICLPTEQEQVLPNRGLVTGWGITRYWAREDETPGSKLLRKVPLPIWSMENCKHVYPNVWHKQFCAGGYKKMDSCHGDSGGPLQTISKYRGSYRMVQRGIVSYGKKICGKEDIPGVYTHVAYYVNWILDRLRA